MDERREGREGRRGMGEWMRAEKGGREGKDVKGNISKGMDTVRSRGNGALCWEVADSYLAYHLTWCTSHMNKHSM